MFKNFNLPNKLAFSRIIMSAALLVMLLTTIILQIPISSSLGQIISVISGVVFSAAAITDMLDGHIARKRNMVTDTGKILDAMADKALVNPTLIAMALLFKNPIVIFSAAIIVFRDGITDTIKSVSGANGKVIAASKGGKIKTVFVMSGAALKFFAIPAFGSIGTIIDIAANLLLLGGTALSITSGIEYYKNNKEMLFAENPTQETKMPPKEEQELELTPSLSKNQPAPLTVYLAKLAQSEQTLAKEGTLDATQSAKEAEPTRTLGNPNK